VDTRLIDALNKSAACVGADPKLFDAIEPMTAARGLAYCARCTAVALCRTVLRPGRTGYDGVAAAAVYRNGRVVVSLARDSQTRALVSVLLERSHPQ